MAVQTGCGFKPPTPVFAVPLPVSAEPPRRPDVTSSPTRDPGNDVIMAGRRSGQWVTLSKTLLLQLVERICQLSFQTDVVTSSNASSRLCRKSSDELCPEVETENLQPRCLSAEHGLSPSELIGLSSEKRDEQNGMEDSAVAEENQTLLCRDDSVPTLSDNDQTTSDSGETSGDVNLPAASCCSGIPSLMIELDVDNAGVSIEKTETGCIRTVAEAVRGPRDASTSDENQPNDRHHCYHHHYHHHRRQRSACRRRLLWTRRRKKAAALATSGGQVRYQVTARRGDDTSTATERRPHLYGVRRCRQSWMALSKDIVYGAVENELRQVEGTCRSVVPAFGGSAASKSAAIWNPATCLSASEKRRSRASYSDLDCAPALPDFRHRDVTFHQSGNDDVIGRPRDASSTGSSSMLSELLGFGSAVVRPTDLVLTRERRCSCSGGETTTSCDVISPSVISGSGVENHSHDRPVSESSRRDDVTSALNYCIRRDTNSAQEETASAAVQPIWRPVEPHPVKSTTRRVTRPRWVAVNKGDVCSLVDSLVSTMIVSEDRSTENVVTSGAGDVRDASTVVATPQPSASSLLSSSSSSCDKPALPVSARCSVVASEPRKWKSDLLQRMRNEDT